MKWNIERQFCKILQLDKENPTQNTEQLKSRDISNKKQFLQVQETCAKKTQCGGSEQLCTLLKLPILDFTGHMTCIS